jgi:hypothetical protein
LQVSEMLDFEYHMLERRERLAVEEHTTEIRRLTRRAAEDIVEIGQRLIEVKTMLQYGLFGSWLHMEFGWGERTARNFMQVAEVFKTANFAEVQIAPSALYALASGSTPDFIRDEMLGMAEATGAPITHKAVQERLQRKKQDKPVKAKEPYVPLPVEYEEREHEDGTFHLYPKPVDPPKKQEIKERDWDRAARRFENTASTALTALGQLEGYDLPDLLAVVGSAPGTAMGAHMRLHLLKQRMQSLLEKWENMEAAQHTLDAEPMLELLPPDRERDKSLTVN